jgi:hypothetical protein
MAYRPSSLKELPRGRQFLQDLVATPLKEADLSSKYGFVFERVSDDLSSCEVCVVKGNSGSYFLIVCRGELPEWQVAIRSASSSEPLESYAPRMLAEFIETVDFDAQDIEHIWPFTR